MFLIRTFYDNWKYALNSQNETLKYMTTWRRAKQRKRKALPMEHSLSTKQNVVAMLIMMV